MLESLLFDEDLNAVLYNYYRRQPYYRNQPRLYRNEWDGSSALISSSRYHVDRFHQISLMLLINDLTADDMHMKYAIGSHQAFRLRFGSSLDAAAVESRHSIADFVGASGTLYVFDSAGIHRGHYTPGTARKILHLNITPGHDIEPGRYDLLNTWTLLDQYPEHSRRMVEKVGIRTKRPLY